MKVVKSSSFDGNSVNLWILPCIILLDFDKKKSRENEGSQIILSQIYIIETPLFNGKLVNICILPKKSRENEGISSFC